MTTYVNGLTNALNRNDKLEVSILARKENRESIEEFFPEINKLYVTPRLEKVCKFIDKINFNFLGSTLLLSYTQRIRWSKALSSLNNGFAVIYVPTTYINFVLENAFLVTSLHDIQERTYPENFSKKQRRFRDANVRNTLKNSDLIQVSSEYVESEIKKYYAQYALKTDIRVIYEGVDPELFNNPELVEKRHHVFLCPASYHPHKNHNFLANTLSMYTESSPIEIRYCGNGIDAIENLLVSQNTNVTSHILGALPTAELISEYLEAEYVILPTLYESSSLPILEAIAMKCIVLASNIPPHLEQQKYLEIFTFNPADATSLLETIFRVENLKKSEKTELIQRNNIKIRQFHWDKIATEYLISFQNLFSEETQFSRD